MNLSEFIGIQYTNRGRSIETGFDCMGLAYEVSKEVYGKVLPELVYQYKDSESYEEMYRSFETSISRYIRVDLPSVGDLIVFRICGFACHVGIYIGGERFIHSLKGHNSGIESLGSAIWRNRIEGYYRC